jgi:hypothetical protein
LYFVENNNKYTFIGRFAVEKIFDKYVTLIPFDNKTGFINYMVEVNGKTSTTAYRYGEAVERISRKYSRNMGQYIDIYQIEDLDKLYSIESEYEMGIYYIKSGSGKAVNVLLQALIAYIDFIEQQDIFKDAEGVTAEDIKAAGTDELVKRGLFDKIGGEKGDRIYREYEKLTPEEKVYFVTSIDLEF